VDTSCAPADILYPTDLSLLNEGREKSEGIIDVLGDVPGRPPVSNRNNCPYVPPSCSLHAFSVRCECGRRCRM
jgi:hypothetical protein